MKRKRTFREWLCEIFGHNIHAVYYIDADERYYWCVICGKTYIDKAYEREKKRGKK